MKSLGSVLILALVTQEPVCDHGTRGPSRPVDLKEVARLHAEAERAFASFRVPASQPFEDSSFDSGLPACRTRMTRRIRVEPLPAEMKPLYFAREGVQPPTSALLVTTRARRLADATLPAGPELTTRVGVRCAPTLVRLLSSTEVELLEGETP